MAVTIEGSTEVPAGDGGAPQDGIQTSGAPASGSSDAAALTAEQRDAATFARHGMNPDGSPLTPKVDPPADPPVAADPKPDPKPAAKDADPKPADGDKAGDDADDDDDDAAEISDERITATIEAALELNPDLVKNNPKLREALEKEVRATIQAEIDQKTAATSASQQREQLIQKGKEASDALTSLTDKAHTELMKAKNGDDNVNWDVVVGASKDIAGLLSTFGGAYAADTQRGYEQAFTKGFITAQKIGGPMTPEESAAMQEIVNSANRIEADEKQGDGRFDLAKQHFYEKSMTLLVERAKAAGKVEAVAEAKAKRDARKNVLDSDAVIAGAAKEAAKRVKLPPAPTEGGPVTTIVQPTMDAYQVAKAAKNYDLADEIMRAMGSQTPATTRR